MAGKDNQPQQPDTSAVLERIAQNRGLTTNRANSTQTSPMSSTAPTPRNCPHCGGTGFVIPDLPFGAPGFGRAVRCNRCDTGLAAHSGLNAQELTLTAAAIKGRNDTAGALRYLTQYITEHPHGWLVLWGEYGTAKTLAVQAIVAQLLQRRMLARFYHGRQLEQGWFDDMHGDSANGQLYRRLPVLAIDEIDKINFQNSWVRSGFQELMDSRYRLGIADEQLTLMICQTDPATTLPGDVVSRMNDGRFFRPWTGGANRHVVSRWDERWLPGVLQTAGADARPMLKPNTDRMTYANT